MRCAILISTLLTGGSLIVAQDRGPTQSKPTPPAEAEARELRPRDRLLYRVDEDPMPGAEPMSVEVTDLHKAQFKVSRGYDKSVVCDVKGKKLPEIRAEVKRLLESEYYNHATISIELAAVGNRSTLDGNGAKAIFLGEVRGFVELPEGQKVMLSEAILRLTYTDWANLEKVQIMRKDDDGKPLPTINVDVDKILRKNRLDLDVELKDGDRVKVPQKVFKSFRN